MFNLLLGAMRIYQGQALGACPLNPTDSLEELRIPMESDIAEQWPTLFSDTQHEDNHVSTDPGH